jgi:FkbM family methyltransferase
MRRARALVQTARVTDRPAAFIGRELAARGRRGNGDLASYRLQGFGCEVGLRHGTIDIPLLFDIMVERSYEPPGQVLDAAGPEGLRLIDLGANIGLSSLFLASVLPIAGLVAYEPDPRRAAQLRSNLGGCPALGGWRVVEACAGARGGEVDFQLAGESRFSRIVPGDRSGVSRRVPVVDAFPDLLEADVAKIDIEGGEWELLGDPRFGDLAARALVLEYHAWLCPEPDPRGLALGALAAAGYEVREAGEHIPGFGEVWAWRR